MFFMKIFCQNISAYIQILSLLIQSKRPVYCLSQFYIVISSIYIIYSFLSFFISILNVLCPFRFILNVE